MLILDTYKLYTYELSEGYSKSLVTHAGSTTLHKLARSNETGKLREYLRNHKDGVDVVDPEHGVTPLISAILAGNLTGVKTLVKFGANVNFKCTGLNGWGMKYTVTPLYVAAECNYLSIVDYLGKKGADVNFKCQPQGFTPVCIAVNRGYVDLVALLIEEFKADVNIPSRHSDLSYPLIRAMGDTNLDMLSLLLSAKGADPDVADSNEHVTALHTAAFKGDLPAMKMLVTHGANVNAELVSGHTPLDIAIMMRRAQGNFPKSPLVSFLRSKGGITKKLGQKWIPFLLHFSDFPLIKQAIIRGANPNATADKGFPVLFSMVLRQDTTHCKFLLRRGADINGRDFFGNTALHLACEVFKGTRAVVKMVEFLLDNGADVNAKNHAGSTPLHRSCEQGLVAISNVLISRGADLYAYMHETGPPIFMAALAGHTRICRLILSAGYDPNTKFRTDSMESTCALHIACYHAADSPETIKVLIEYGADVNLPQESRYGKMYPLHVVSSNTPKFTKSLIVMLEAGAFIDAECFPMLNPLLQIAGQKTDVLKSIIESSGNRKAALVYNSTVELFKAVRKNDLVAVQRWESLRGLVNCCSVKFETPLTYASWKGYLDIVKFLLKKGAKVHLPCVKKSSPLHYAAKFDRKDVAVTLLRAGAPLDLECCGKTPVELARMGRHDAMADLLAFAQKWLQETGQDGIRPVPNFRAHPAFPKVVQECGGKLPDLKYLTDLFAPKK